MIGPNRPRVLTWHVHGSYLYYLTQTNCDFFLPVTGSRSISGYGGKVGPFNWGENVHEIPVDDIRNTVFDCILYQSKATYTDEAEELLSEEQRALPSIYLEHDPPREHPTDTLHPAADSDTLIVHVTPFNRLMWNNGTAKAVVIDHGVRVPEGITWTGEIPRGVVVINNLPTRGRRLGLDIFEYLRDKVPLDLVGMDSEAIDGQGEVPHDRIPEYVSRYRFFLNPIRYTSLGLSLLEAMMMGMPIAALATTEIVTVVEDGVQGVTATDPAELVPKMHRMLEDKQWAARLGNEARIRAAERFGITRFANDWERTIRTWSAKSVPVHAPVTRSGPRL